MKIKLVLLMMMVLFLNIKGAENSQRVPEVEKSEEREKFSLQEYARVLSLDEKQTSQRVSRSSLFFDPKVILIFVTGIALGGGAMWWYYNNEQPGY